MYRRYRTWMLVIATALLALPALAADEVIPATSEDIEAFDRALTRTRQRESADEQVPSAAQARTRANAEVRSDNHAAEPAGDAAKTTERVRTRTRTEDQLSMAVAEEAQEMKRARAREHEKALDRNRERLEEQVEEGQGTQERARTMRDFGGGGPGNQYGQGGDPSGPGGGSQGGSSGDPGGPGGGNPAGSSGDSGQQSGGRAGR